MLEELIIEIAGEILEVILEFAASAKKNKEKKKKKSYK